MLPKLENSKDTKNLSQKNNSKKNHPVRQTPQFFPINTFDPSNCLFWATVLAYLFDFKYSDSAFDVDDEVYSLRFSSACRMFGEVSVTEEKKLKSLVGQFYKTQDLTFIYRNPILQRVVALFRQRVVDYMEQHAGTFQYLIKGDLVDYLRSMRLPNRFAGKTEIVAIAALLGCNVKLIDIKTRQVVIYPSSEDQFSSLVQEHGPCIQIRILCLFYEANTSCYYFSLEENLALEKTNELIPSSVSAVKSAVENNSAEENNWQDLRSVLHFIEAPSDHSCLFWAAALSYLVLSTEPVVERWKKLFGDFPCPDDVEEEIEACSLDSIETLKQTPIFACLVSRIFRCRVVEYMRLHRHQFEFDAENIEAYFEEMLLPNTWGSWQEVKAISGLLGCKIFVFTSWDKELQDPLIAGVGLPLLYLFYSHENGHYNFAILKANLQNAENDTTTKPNRAIEPNHTKDKGISVRKIKKRNWPAKQEDNKALRPFLQRLPDDVLGGIAVGLFIEATLLTIPASLPVRFFLQRESINTSTFFNHSEYIFFGYPEDFYSPALRNFLLSPTLVDTELAKYLDLKKILASGIAWGAIGGLIKAIMETDIMNQWVLIGISMSSIYPVEHKETEGVQLYLRIFLAVLLSTRGLINMVDFFLPRVVKITGVAKGLTDQITQKTMSSCKAAYSFFSNFSKKETENTENNVMCTSSDLIVQSS